MHQLMQLGLVRDATQLMDRDLIIWAIVTTTIMTIFILGLINGVASNG